MNQAVIYRRVSTDEQGVSGLGLDAQRAACLQFCSNNGFTVAGECADEGISGAKSLDKRPGLIEAIKLLEAGDILLIAKRDRLARDPIISAMIEASAERKGARIVSVAGEGTEGDDPSNILMRRMVDAFAEYERLLIGARTAAALKAKRARNEKTGGDVPFGFNLAADGVHLEDNELEQAIVSRIRELKDGGYSLRKIAKALNEDGITTKRGKEWTPVQVSRILKAA